MSSTAKSCGWGPIVSTIGLTYCVVASGCIRMNAEKLSAAYRRLLSPAVGARDWTIKLTAGDSGVVICRWMNWTLISFSPDTMYWAMSRWSVIAMMDS